jgi:hypothetical protein
MALGVGCSNAPSPGVTPQPSSESPRDAGAPSEDAAQGAVDAASCATNPLPAPQGTQAFHSLTASLVDEHGAAQPDVPLTVCGFDVCLNGKVDDAGAARVQNADGGPPMQHPALKIGEGMTFAELAYPLPDHADFDLGTTVAVPLPSAADGVAFAAGSTVTSGDVTLTLAPDTVIAFDLLTYPPDARGLRAKAISLAKAPLAIDPAARLELAYAIVPQGTTFCPPASLELPNSLGWPAGTDVEFLAHGVDLEQRWAPYGGWAVVTTGNVTSDGKRIATAPGHGVPGLFALGVRRTAK